MIKRIKIHYGNYQITQQYIKLGIAVKKEEVQLYMSIIILIIKHIHVSRSTHVLDLFNFVFQNGVFPVINRPTRVTKRSATIIDHILTNTLIDSRIQSSILKTDIRDHFVVFSLLKTNFELINIKKTIIKRDINEDSMKYFKTIFNSTDWDLLTQTSSTNDSHNIFIERFIIIYD